MPTLRKSWTPPTSGLCSLGIQERRKADPDHESQVSMATKALDAALSDAGMKGSDLDLVINGTCSPDSTVPSGACRVAANVGDACWCI